MRTIKLCALAFGLAGAYAHAGVVVNGDFQTGNLTGWTSYTTAYGPGTGTNGTCAGSVPCPIVTVFDTTGTGASNAAQFNVGLATGTPGGSDYEGGGIVQNISLSPGAFNVSLDWAVDNLFTGTNSDGGEFTILLDGTALKFFDTGSVGSGAVVRGTLSVGTTIATGGTYQLAVEVTRPWTPAPDLTQYVDNVTTSGAATGGGAVPEPSGWELAVGGMVLIAGYRRLRTVCRP